MPEAPVLPSWRFHLSGTSRIITTVEELQALEAGEWFESPAEAAHAAASATEGASQPEGEAHESRPRSRR
jgi:hypothetical protein